MWVNVRCFDLTTLTLQDWALVGAGVVILAAVVMIFKKRDDIRGMFHIR